jgi:hypothetical protein
MMGLVLSETTLQRFGRARTSALTIFSCLLLLACVPREARAGGFIGYYAPAGFTLANVGGFLPNGSVSFPDTMTLILTGTNDGSGLPGATDLTIPAQAAGLLEFSYLFTTLDDPGFENAGYLLSGQLFPLADTSGESGSVIVPVSSGEIIGFSAGSVDDTGGAGVLTVTDFVGPLAPEPSSMQLLMLGAAAILARLWRSPFQRK